MLKASFLDISFRTHHGLGRVLSSFPACLNQRRLVSTFDPLVHRVGDAGYEHLSMTSVNEGGKERKMDGRATSLIFSHPPYGRMEERCKFPEKKLRRGRIVGELSGATQASQKCPPTELRQKQKHGIQRRGVMDRNQIQDAKGVPDVLVQAGADVVRRFEKRGGRVLQEDIRRTGFVTAAQAWVREGAITRNKASISKIFNASKRRHHNPRRVKGLKNGIRGEGGEKFARIRRLQRTIRTTSSADNAWEAYQSLLSLEAEDKSQDHSGVVWSEKLSCRLLTRLSLLLSRVRPPTRQVFLRYLSLLARLRQVRPTGLIYTWEWNTLINLAGSGFRKTPLDQYNSALNIYHDMRRSASSLEASDNAAASRPDIYTYTILLSIAARTRHGPAVRHAIALLHSSGLKPSRVTYTALARYRLIFEGLTGVRDGLQAMMKGGHEIGIDGVNTFIWAAGKEGQVEAALKVYRVLRRHFEILQDEKLYGADRHEELKPLTVHERHVKTTGSKSPTDTQTPSLNPFLGPPSAIEGITLSRKLVPDQITYTTMIQILTYHGYLVDALGVLSDMLVTPQKNSDGTECFEPTGAVFRAFLRGYAKHGHRTRSSGDEKPRISLYSREAEWDWERLRVILDAFFSMPKGTLKPRARDIYWAITATEKCTGRNPQQCREVWLKLKECFHFVLDGRMKELDRRYTQTP